MSSPIKSQIALFTLIATFATSALTQETPAQEAKTKQQATSTTYTTLTPRQAIDLAIQQNPDLRLTLIETQRAELAVESAEARRTPIFSADAGYRYGQSPRLSPTGTQLIGSSALTFGAQLAHTLPVGTQLSVNASFGRSLRDSVELGDLGLGYDTSIGIEATQPLLRGFGKDVVNANIRSAQLARQSIDTQQLAEANAITARTLTAFWDLWLAQQNVLIQQAALEIAQQNIQNAEIRLETGTIAPADLIPLRLELTNIESSLVTAHNTVRQRSTDLANLTGQNPERQLQASSELPADTSLPDIQTALSHYKENSYDIARQKIAIQSAQIQEFLARNDAKPRLDAVASFQLAGLDQQALQSLSELAKFNAFTAFAGLRLELPIKNRAATAEATRAQLATQAAQFELERQETNAHARVVTLLNDAQTAQDRITLAQQSAELARQSVDAQTARFDTGRGTSFDVVTALQRYQEAELRIVETQVDIIRRILSIDELTGQLLQRWDISL